MLFTRNLAHPINSFNRPDSTLNQELFNKNINVTQLYMGLPDDTTKESLTQAMISDEWVPISNMNTCIYRQEELKQ